RPGRRLGPGPRPAGGRLGRRRRGRTGIARSRSAPGRHPPCATPSRPPRRVVIRPDPLYKEGRRGQAHISSEVRQLLSCQHAPVVVKSPSSTLYTIRTVSFWSQIRTSSPFPFLAHACSRSKLTTAGT